MKKKLFLSIIVFLITIISFLYFQFRETPVQIQDLEKVTVQLKWVHQSQFAGLYAAKEKGFYEEEGLDVSFIPFSFDMVSPMKVVSDGNAQFGIADSIQLITSRSEGIKIKAIGVIYKKSVSTFYSLAEKGIITPPDLVGKIIGVQPSQDMRAMVNLFLKNTKINPSTVTLVDTGYDAKDLLEGRIDVSTGYIINEPHQAIKAGYGVNTMFMADYGIRLYGDLIFTTDEIIKNRPDLVLRFLRASLKGWRYAVEKPEEAVSFVLKYTTDRTENHETYMLDQSIPLIHTINEPLGWMDQAGWTKSQSILFEAGLIDKIQDVSEFFNSQFLNTIYHEDTL